MVLSSSIGSLTGLVRESTTAEMNPPPSFRWAGSVLSHFSVRQSWMSSFEVASKPTLKRTFASVPSIVAAVMSRASASWATP